MGNRGILHENGEIVRKWMHRGWISCLLDHDGNHRDVMSEGRYTELFFLDEATALSAGHRPCFDCQRDRFYKFRTFWLLANARTHQMDEPTMAAIDRILHQERITKAGKKVTYQDNALNVARGAFIELGSKYYLKWTSRFYEWSAAGYLSSITIPHNQQVKVLTPKSIVHMFIAFVYLEDKGNPLPDAGLVIFGYEKSKLIGYRGVIGLDSGWAALRAGWPCILLGAIFGLGGGYVLGDRIRRFLAIDSASNEAVKKAKEYETSATFKLAYCCTQEVKIIKDFEQIRADNIVLAAKRRELQQEKEQFDKLVKNYSSNELSKAKTTIQKLEKQLKNLKGKSELTTG